MEGRNSQEAISKGQAVSTVFNKKQSARHPYQKGERLQEMEAQTAITGRTRGKRKPE